MKVSQIDSQNFSALRIRKKNLIRFTDLPSAGIERMAKIAESVNDTKTFHLESTAPGDYVITGPRGAVFERPLIVPPQKETPDILGIETTWGGKYKKGTKFLFQIKYDTPEKAQEEYNRLNEYSYNPPIKGLYESYYAEVVKFLDKVFSNQQVKEHLALVDTPSKEYDELLDSTKKRLKENVKGIVITG